MIPDISAWYQVTQHDTKYLSMITSTKYLSMIPSISAWYWVNQNDIKYLSMLTSIRHAGLKGGLGVLSYSPL